MGRNIILISILLCGIFLCWILFPDNANSGPYLDSAHGDTSYGVDRTSLSAFGYSKGNCAHCHEQHGMIGGSEPDPTGGPDIYALFYDNHVDQTDNFCYKCHTDLSSLQTGGLVNRSYSYRAGGWTADSVNDILEAFSFYPASANPGSSHQLGYIRSFVTARSWGYTNNSNPCAACHNPHRIQGDPENSPNGTKSSGTRGWPVSRPSQHSTDNNEWGLWGDNISDDSPYGASAERMSNYASGFTYLAPYYFNSTTTYEPEGNSTNDGSNLTDYVTFCTECHNPTYDGQVSSAQKSAFTGGWQPLLYNPDWEGTSPHGRIDGSRSDTMRRTAPYDAAERNYVLSCTDCHEPHGSPNNGMLIRRVVNGSTTLVDFSGWSDRSKWLTLCQRCHNIGSGHQSGSPCYICHMHNRNWFEPI